MNPKKKYYIAINKMYNLQLTNAPDWERGFLFDEDTDAILTVALYDPEITAQDMRKLKSYCNRLSERIVDM